MTSAVDTLPDGLLDLIIPAFISSGSLSRVQSLRQRSPLLEKADLLQWRGDFRHAFRHGLTYSHPSRAIFMVGFALNLWPETHDIHRYRRRNVARRRAASRHQTCLQCPDWENIETGFSLWVLLHSTRSTWTQITNLFRTITNWSAKVFLKPLPDGCRGRDGVTPILCMLE